MFSRIDIRTFLPLAAILLALSALIPVISGCGDDDKSGSDYDALISALASDDDARRQQAVDQLVGAGEPAVEPLIAVFTGENQDLPLLKGAKETLAQLGEPAIQPLIDSFSYTGVKSTTALAWKKNTLSLIGEPAVGPLVLALGSEDATTRAAAADTLGDIGDKNAVDGLAGILDDGDDSAREQAAEALGAIGDPRAIAPLTEALDDEKRDIRQAVRDALVAIREAVGADPQLQKAFDTCIAVEVKPITDPYGLVIAPNGAMVNPEVLFGLTDDEKLYILDILGECVLINQQ